MRQLLATAALAAAITAAIAPTAAAQPTVTPSIYCVPGATHACFAAAFAASGESASLWIQNLQGTRTPDPTAWVIGTVVVERTSETRQFVWNALGPPTPWISAEGAVRTQGVEWGVSQDGDAGVGAEQQRVYSTGTSETGLAGCTDPFAGTSDVYFGWFTCARDDGAGWLRFDFRAFMSYPYEGPGAHGDFIREVTLADVDLTIGAPLLELGCTIRGANSGTSRALRPGCLVSPYTLAMVPEPATVVLLGGGLAALGGIAAVRRRRGV